MDNFLGLWKPEPSFHKTATSLAKKAATHAFGCAITGVTEVDWSKHWLSAMQELNIDVDR